MKHTRPNALGDVRAESDGHMLSQAFVETPDYRALIESSDRTIVVGRRGTGKSALVQGLRRYWEKNDNVDVLSIVPEEYEALALRPLASLFGPHFEHIRAGIRVAWRYAFMMETVRTMSRHYYFKRHSQSNFLVSQLKHWDSLGRHILDKYRALLRSSIDRDMPTEGRIGDLAQKLDLQKVEEGVVEMAKETKRELVILVDCLDEGYQPDDVGVGVVDGLIQGAIDIKARPLGVRPLVFLRDNIFRSIQLKDRDYSRNIEGNVLRLHWDAHTLYDFVTRRIRVAFDVKEQSSVRIWNRVVGGGLKGRSGFESIVRMTLHRPRDILTLLNEAFFRVGPGGIDSKRIVEVGKLMSENRLNDLVAEYQALFPAIRTLINLFRGKPAEWQVREIHMKVDELQRDEGDPLVRQEMTLVYPSVVDVLFGIGFLGVGVGEGTFSFCHDGRRRDASVGEGRALVHPCYWMALDCLTADGAEMSEIYDEYSIETSRASPSVRKGMIDDHVSALDGIVVGREGATEFEVWCANAIRICFAKGLRNVERNPNPQGPLRPDVLATNVGEGNFWKRVYDDYRCRQVVFEMKNKDALDAEDYHQITSYLGGDYGNIAFFVTREAGIELRRGGDLDRVREIYTRQGVLVVKLTGRFFCQLLRKLKDPRRHDDVNDALHKVLDTYTRLYIRGQGGERERRGKKRRRGRKRR